MQIKELMTSPPVFVASTSTAEEASKLMLDHNIGCIPVCENDSPIGIITDRDIVLRVIATGLDPKTTMASDIMSKSIATVTPDMSVYDASRIMSDYQIRRIPVIENQKLVGVVALGDMAVTCGCDVEAAEALCDISEKKKPH